MSDSRLEIIPPAGLYIHVPFCLKKCQYCDFFSSTQTNLRKNWAKSLISEAHLADFPVKSFDTFYLGGGTPSLLQPETLEEIRVDLYEIFEFSSDAEKTIEVNPDDVTVEAARQWRNIGFNRISLGIQSFSDDQLQFLGRRHSSGQSVQAIEIVRDQGFDNISIDLIYGLPGQTPDQWIEDLKKGLEFSPEHFSCYQLTVEPNTPLGKLADRGLIRLPGEEIGRELFVLTHKILEDNGFEHYEISNFSRSQALRSRHNQKYWHHESYLGLGPGAHSFDGEKRWWNIRSIQSYIENLIDRENLPVEDSEILSPDQLDLEKIYLGFRTSDGIEAEFFSGKAQWLATIDKLYDEGLIRACGERFIPTVEGFLIADSLALRFD